MKQLYQNLMERSKNLTEKKSGSIYNTSPFSVNNSAFHDCHAVTAQPSWKDRKKPQPPLLKETKTKTPP